MSDTKKIRRAASVLLVIIGIVFLCFVIQLVKGIILNSKYGGWTAFTITNYIIGVFIVLASLSIGASLLYSIRKEETPFNSKNVKKLKSIAVLLIIYEPYYSLVHLLFNKFIPIVIDDNTSVVVESSLGGIVFVTGLVVYCVALVFEYGINLQNQIDETL
jgi:hypothetical protein